ncbi:hypothetical protein EV359DRAFT_87356 [Lentinula novae-zelandiae]|nr:hypothetical protein EV359DRAFT_87356 [Lentinula novae-zelandiae]
MPSIPSRLALVKLSRALIPYKVPSTAIIIHPSMPIHHKKDLDIARVAEPHLGALQQLLASYKGKKTNNPDKATISVLRRSTKYLHDLLEKPVTLRSHVRQISNLTARQSIIDTLCLGHKLFPDIVSDSHFEQHLKFMAFANDARNTFVRNCLLNRARSVHSDHEASSHSNNSRFIRKSKKKATRSALSRDVKRELRSVHFDSDVEMNSASEDELVSGTERSFKQKPAVSFIKNRRSTPYPTTGSNKGSNKDEKSAVNDVSPCPSKIHCHADSHASSNLTHSKHINHALAQVISSNLDTPPAPLESQSTKFIAATLNFQAAEFEFNANLVKTYATRARIAKVIADEACSILKSRQDSGSDSSDASFATAQSITTAGSEDTVVTPMEIAVPVIKTVERATTPFTRGVTPMMEDKGHVSA